MDIEDLRTFVDVADAGGVSSAARRLGVSKSIVSRRLFRLEAELGVQLLARTTRGAALTEAGVTFREHAAGVCAEIDIALETIMPAGELRGRLRIAAPLWDRRIWRRCLQKWRGATRCSTCRRAIAIASSISLGRVSTVRYASAISATRT